MYDLDLGGKEEGRERRLRGEDKSKRGGERERQRQAEQNCDPMLQSTASEVSLV